MRKFESPASAERIRIANLLECNGPSVAVFFSADLLANNHASLQEWISEIKGASSVQAREPDCLRSQLGSKSRIFKFVHSPDDMPDMIRDLIIHFGANASSVFREMLKNNGGNENELIAFEDARPRHGLEYSDVVANIGWSKEKINWFEGLVFEEKSRVLELCHPHLNTWEKLTLLEKGFEF